MDDATVVYENEDATVVANPKPEKSQKSSYEPKKSTKPKSRSKKKSKLGIEYNAPVSLTFSIFCLVAFVLEKFLLEKMVPDLHLFTSLTKQGSEFAFVASNPVHYVRLITYVFGAVNWNQLFISLILVLLLGPSLEINYGGKLLFVMMLISSFVSGVISACFSTVTLSGASSVIFMMIILSSYSAIEKKRMPLSLIFVFIFFFAKETMEMLAETSCFYPVLISLLGGFLGCVFGFIATPIKRGKKK